MRKLSTWIMLLLLCLFLLIPACSGPTIGSAVERTVILIVVLIIVVVLCALVALGVAVWQFLRHNRDKVSEIHTTVKDVKQAVDSLKK